MAQMFSLHIFFSFQVSQQTQYSFSLNSKFAIVQFQIMSFVFHLVLESFTKVGHLAYSEIKQIPFAKRLLIRWLLDNPVAVCWNSLSTKLLS